ncbi:MAG: glycosyltransferase family 39 protein [Methanolinea sp.]|nr:glycosyltransferase family 39 protein [Methanolinea sp.]
MAGATLRFYKLDFNSLWLDEAFTYNAAKGSLAEIWNTMEVGDFHPPLFHWIEHFMLALGNSEFILRLVPAIAGICTIPVFYLVGKELADERVGVIAAALLAFSPFHIYYSQEAYSYSLVLLVFSILLYSYLRVLRTGERRFYIAVGILSALAFWIHFYTAIPVSFVYIHAVLHAYWTRGSLSLESLKDVFYSGLTFVVLISPLIPVVIQRYFTLTARPPTYGVLGLPLISETFTRFSSFSPILAILFVVTFAAGALFLYRENKSTFVLWVILISLPLLLSVVLSSKMTMNPRYLIFLLAVFYPGMACAYQWTRRFSTKKWVVFSFIVLFALCYTPTLVSYYSGYTKENWRDLAKIMEQKTYPGDIIVLVPSYLELPFKYYYKNETDETVLLGASSVRELERITYLRGNRTVYYIMTGDVWAANPEGDVVRWLEKNATYKGTLTQIHVFSSP